MGETPVYRKKGESVYLEFENWIITTFLVTLADCECNENTISQRGKD